MISGKVHRTIAVIAGAVMMIGFGMMTFDEAMVDYVEWEALGLIFGMFIIIAALTESGFFRWMGLYILRAAKFQPLRIFLFFSVLAAVLAAFMDSITVLIFMASLIIEVTTILKMPVLPFLLGAITSANIGGSATIVGNPPNVIIGSYLSSVAPGGGFTFIDFVLNAGPIALVVFFVNLAFFYIWYKKIFKDPEINMDTIYKEHADLDPYTAVKDHRLMTLSLSIFAFTVTLLILHHTLELAIAFVAIMGATLILLFGGEKMPELVEKIDWHTILFLGGLFIMVGGLRAVGVLDSVANSMVSISGNNLILMLMLILWISSFASAFLDNVPFAAAMVSVIYSISQTTTLPLAPMAYTLVMGCNTGGNATPIGASANVVGIAVAQKHNVEITWKEYCKSAFPAMIVSNIAVSIMVILMFAV